LLNAEVCAITPESQAMRSHHSDLLPLARIPPEILYLILLFHSEFDPPIDDSDDSACLGWIRATHVCRRWRHVALAYNSLWTHISSELGPYWTDTFLERSKPLPV
ncbi:hypothetical protein FA95DRAFT_1471724, partial [Auriscalpium vulgare]